MSRGSPECGHTHEGIAGRTWEPGCAPSTGSPSPLEEEPLEACALSPAPLASPPLPRAALPGAGPVLWNFSRKSVYLVLAQKSELNCHAVYLARSRGLRSRNCLRSACQWLWAAAVPPTETLGKEPAAAVLVLPAVCSFGGEPLHRRGRRTPVSA